MLVEEAQQPRLARLEARRSARQRVPHLDGAAERADSRRALPCRRRTDRRRRCRPRSPASRCAPDCTWWSPADGADRAASRPARRDRRRRGRARDSSASKTMRFTSSSMSRPLMRRMNSMLDGHQGASARTSSMYLSIASCVAGSFHDSGRCTMRRRHRPCRRSAEAVPRAPTARRAGVARQDARCRSGSAASGCPASGR